MSLLAYLIAGIALVGALGGLYFKINHDGYERGKGEVQVAWDADVAARKADAEKERLRQDGLRQTQEKVYAKTLTDARKRSLELLGSLDAHIKAARLPSSCRITPELLSDANSALAGPEGERTRTVPTKPGVAAPAR